MKIFIILFDFYARWVFLNPMWSLKRNFIFVLAHFNIGHPVKEVTNDISLYITWRHLWMVPSTRAIWIDGGIHAREWIATTTALYLINNLVESFKNPKADDALTNVKGKIEFTSEWDIHSRSLFIINSKGYLVMNVPTTWFL